MYSHIQVGLIAILVVMSLSCTADKPKQVKTSPEAERALLLAGMTKELKREIVDLHAIDAEERWAFQLNDICKDKACLVEATIAEISRTKDGYFLHAEAFFPDYSRTWKVRVLAKEVTLGAFAKRNQYDSKYLILDQVHFQVIDSLAAAKEDDDASVDEGESQPFTVTLSDETALLVTGRVLAVVTDDPKPAVELAP